MNCRYIGLVLGLLLQSVISLNGFASEVNAAAPVEPDFICSQPIRNGEGFRALSKIEKIAAIAGNAGPIIGQPATNVDFAPSRATIHLGIRQPFAEFSKLGTVHAIFQSRLEPIPVTDPDAIRSLSKFNIHPHKAIETDSLRKSGIVEPDDTIISLDLPEFDQASWEMGRITIYVCGPQKQDSQKYDVTFVSQSDLRVTGWWTCLTLSLLVSIFGYFFIAYMVAGYENSFREKFDIPKVAWIYYLSPIRLASGADGRGSPSRIQALVFAFLVGLLSLYTTLRTGVLSDLSPSVATLLGISAAGAVLGKATDVARNSLSATNSAWLVSYGWLKEGSSWRQKPEWRHLITSDDGFDLQRAQMLGFSVVVALALVERGASGLSTFAIPDTVNQILGISQLVYIGGKAVGPASIKDLDGAIDKLRELENTLASKVSLEVNQLLTRDVAKAVGALAEFGAYYEQAMVVRKLVSVIFETAQVNSVQTARFNRLSFAT